MKTFFISDHHFGHSKIIKFCNRPFKTVDEMDFEMIDRWNAVVRPNDNVYHIGDLSFLSARETSVLLDCINGNIHLLQGNHDKRWLNGDTKNKLVWVKPYYELKLWNQKIVLCHYPMISWNRSFHGSFHLYGHIHNNGNAGTEHLRAMNMSVELHDYKPVADEFVFDVLLSRESNKI